MYCKYKFQLRLFTLFLAGKRKHEKNTSDLRDSVTGVRVGAAAGSKGPRIFLLACKKLKNSSFKIGNFEKVHGAPLFSHAVPTPNAYMTDEVWEAIAEPLAKGIQAMPVFKDHPDWWCYLSLDGFGSHLSPVALEVFAKYKILVSKEEGDTSQVSQAYDQHVAKADKRWTREILDGYRFHSSVPVDQYSLMLIANQALNKVTPETWSNSFS